MVDQLRERDFIMSAALECGFMISTMRGQSDDKLMPSSDYATLKAFAERVWQAATSQARDSALESVAAHFEKSHRELWTPAIAEEIRAFQTSPEPEQRQECAANGLTCLYGPHGLNGARQCFYCGESPAQEAPQASELPPAGKFRKKPVVIEAWQVPPDDGQARDLPPQWIISAIACRPPTMTTVEGGGMDIKTLEGTMRADVGDWIIQGVKGELYPCKPDIFEATYEPARTAIASAGAGMPFPEREAIARAIWNIRREDEDRCDMELEDMGSTHSVWREADAVLAICSGAADKLDAQMLDWLSKRDVTFETADGPEFVSYVPEAGHDGSRLRDLVAIHMGNDAARQIQGGGK